MLRDGKRSRELNDRRPSTSRAEMLRIQFDVLERGPCDVSGGRAAGSDNTYNGTPSSVSSAGHEKLTRRRERYSKCALILAQFVYRLL
jgi:hypothetical protein